MNSKIKLNKEKLYVFLGSTNAMPMAYAIELRSLGYNILYFVDASSKDELNRPEMHYPEINYPYPKWIIELRLPSKILVATFPRLFAFIYRAIIWAKTGRKVGAYFLNGFFVSLAPHLGRASKIALSHGSDLDTWANVEKIDHLGKGMSQRSIFKYVPGFLVQPLIGIIVKRQFKGFANSDAALYFPMTFNTEGDKVVEAILAAGGHYAPRYDATFHHISVNANESDQNNGKIVIFPIPRFIFKTFPEGNLGYNKGNDIIIEGIGQYYKFNKNISVHFVDKGEDVDLAKMLCEKFGINDIVTWHKNMPFQEFIDLLGASDICIDQVGDHWIGAGVYAMWLGLPLIANADRSVKAGTWPHDNPVLNVRTPMELCEALQTLEDESTRIAIGKMSHDFVIETMDIRRTLQQVIEF